VKSHRVGGPPGAVSARPSTRFWGRRPEVRCARGSYVPALDGLRALAVAGVLAFHGGVPGAQAGFLGVDVFFVLSGYLITSLLLAESRRTGRIQLLAFWSRRARRLLPALLLMLVTVALSATIPSGR